MSWEQRVYTALFLFPDTSSRTVLRLDRCVISPLTTGREERTSTSFKWKRDATSATKVGGEGKLAWEDRFTGRLHKLRKCSLARSHTSHAHRLNLLHVRTNAKISHSGVRVYTKPVCHPNEARARRVLLLRAECHLLQKAPKTKNFYSWIKKFTQHLYDKLVQCLDQAKHW